MLQYEVLVVNLTTAYILFTKQAVREGRIPFELSTVPTAYGVPDMTRMTKGQLDRALQKGHDDIMAGRVVSSEQVRKSMERKIPFDVSTDPFYSDSNMAHLARGVEALNAGKGVERELIEVEGE